MRLRRPAEEPEIPTASMADIAFLLIIFFMLTSVFAATHGLPYALPEEEQDKAPEGKPAVTIRVKTEAAGGTSLVVDRRPMSLAGLLPYVEGQLRREPGKPVLLYADPDAPYEAMIEVYDELLKAPEVTGLTVENIYVPTTRDVEEYTAVFGFNPFTQEAP